VAIARNLEPVSRQEGNVDDCRFDNWTRAIAGESTRRSAIKHLAGGAAALLTLARAELGLAQDGSVDLEANCNGNGAKCRKDKACCSKKCQKGKCVCAGNNASCKRDKGCCSGVCRSGKCECGDKGDLCNNNSDCCSKVCRDGHCRCIRGGDRCNENKECCSRRCSGGFCENSNV
jgi:hypothetical protein